MILNLPYQDFVKISRHGALIAIDEPNFHKLIPCVQEYLIEHRYEFLQQNIIEILET
ncbi:hypothetical protein RhiirA4_490206, partial [Rhizophagus irregularis]